MPSDEWIKLAILYDKESKFSPSNDEAIEKILSLSVKNNVYCSILNKNQLHDLRNFDCLLIRDTTHPNNYTYEFSIYAELLGLKVIDSSYAIRLGSNKIYQHHLLKKYNILTPETKFITYDNNYDLIPEIKFPSVLKIPDACFSQGVFLIENETKYKRSSNHLFYDNQDVWGKLIVQEFLKTEYDWRIGILNKKIIFSCKYYMSKNDWRIIKYDRNGDYTDGMHETVPIECVPLEVLNAANQCMKFLDHSLFGIDIKFFNDKAYIIEINDNPSIDHGVEDTIEGDKIYDSIIRFFKN